MDDRHESDPAMTDDTRHLLASPRNAERLKRALAQARRTGSAADVVNAEVQAASLSLSLKAALAIFGDEKGEAHMMQTSDPFVAEEAVRLEAEEAVTRQPTDHVALLRQATADITRALTTLRAALAKLEAQHSVGSAIDREQMAAWTKRVNQP